MGLRIIFFGTPDFAVASLNAIAASAHQVVGVVTAPDKPAGRGMQPKASPVKEAAIALNIPVAQPEKLKSPDFHQWLDELNADIYVVVAFRMMPEVVWDRPPHGTFNLHGSLLPYYRGAAPINWAIINGETETGITTFFLKHEIDTGNIIYRESVPIDDSTTFGDLYNVLKEKGARLVVRTLDDVDNDAISPKPQSDFVDDLLNCPEAPKLNRQNTRIDWKSTGHQIVRFAHGLNPFPGAWTHVSGTDQNFKLFKAMAQPCSPEHPAGTATKLNNELIIWTTDGYIEVLEAQLPGKRRMTGKEIANGMHESQLLLS